MPPAQRHPERRSPSDRGARSIRPTIEHESEAADRLLSAFGRARSLAMQARRSKDTTMTSELDRFAWSLVTPADPVRVRYARHRLGVSDPTARAWLDRGILENVGESPRRVTLESLARAEEIAHELRSNGQRRDLTATMERHLQWERMRQSPDFEMGLRRIRRMRQGAPRDHRTAEQRGLAFHRRIAQRLDQQMVAMARRRVNKWLRERGPVPPIWAEQWQTLLKRPLPEIKRVLGQDSDQMRELRQNTPFAGALPETDRMRLVSEIH